MARILAHQITTLKWLEDPTWSLLLFPPKFDLIHSGHPHQGDPAAQWLSWSFALAGPACNPVIFHLAEGSPKFDDHKMKELPTKSLSGARWNTSILLRNRMAERIWCYKAAPISSCGDKRIERSLGIPWYEEDKQICRKAASHLQAHEFPSLIAPSHSQKRRGRRMTPRHAGTFVKKKCTHYETEIYIYTFVYIPKMIVY